MSTTPVPYQRIARVLSSYIGDADLLLDAADAVTGLLAAGDRPAARTHVVVLHGSSAADRLDATGLNSEVVMARLIEGRKIHAIKELRDLSGAGLKQTKDAVERLALLPVVRAAQAAVWNVRVDIGG